MTTSPTGGQVAAFVMQTNAHSVLVIPTEIGGGRQVEVRRHLREWRVDLLALSGFDGCNGQAAARGSSLTRLTSGPTRRLTHPCQIGRPKSGGRSR